jgi:hypothetical protein
MSEHEKEGHDEHHGHQECPEFIHIDHKKYHPKKHTMDGIQLRQLAEPHIGPEYDLWLETPGPGDDEKIEDRREVHLKVRMSFYSVLRQVNPGASNATP